MFPKNPNPTFASSQTALSEQVNTRFAEDLELNAAGFAKAAMHPLERAALEHQEAASFFDERGPLPDGWLNGINTDVDTATVGQIEFNDEWADGEAKFHEPTNAERADGAAVEAILQITPYLSAVRRSGYTAEQLRGMKPEDFDLAM